MLNDYVCALDIGSSKIAGVLARVKNNKITNIYLDTFPIRSVKKGVVVDSVALIGSVTKILKNLRQVSGIKVRSVTVNISGQDIVTRHSKAVIPLVDRGNKVVTLSDMHKVTEQARILGSSLEDEIIHTIPLNYSTDSKLQILNPLGLYSHRLEVDLYLVCARLSSVQTINRIVSQAGYEVKDVYFSGIATSKAVFGSYSRDGLNVICDIGSDTTEILFFREGLLSDIQILSFGGNNMTERISEALKIPLELSEDIKRSYGYIGNPDDIAQDKEILVKKGETYSPIKQRFFCEILNSYAGEMCAGIKDAVEKSSPLYQINNFIVTGRSLLLDGFIEKLESVFGSPVKLGRITNLELISLIKENIELSGQKHLNYITALGMVLKSLEESPVGILPLHRPAKNLFLKTYYKIKDVYQEYF